MSFKITNWAWKQDVPATTKIVLIFLADKANDNGWSWWDQQKIAKRCGYSRQTINKHIAVLRGLGLVQVRPDTHPSGARASNYYRVLAPDIDLTAPPPSKRKASTVEATPVNEGDTPPVNQGDTLNQKDQETEKQNLAALRAAPPEHLGQRKWRVVSSRDGKGPYVVDLAQGSCTCEARRRCKHLVEAERAEKEARTVHGREVRSAMWDVLVEHFGSPGENTRDRSHRGQIVADLLDRLKAEHVPDDQLAEQVTLRYRALVHDWGMGKVTLHSFQRNFYLAGKLLAKSPATTATRQRKYTAASEVE